MIKFVVIAVPNALLKMIHGAEKGTSVITSKKKKRAFKQCQTSLCQICVS